jgi:hypothetical protein
VHVVVLRKGFCSHVSVFAWTARACDDDLVE